jgi:hypothetical protein
MNYAGEVGKCASCGADIKWLRTSKGKRMPVDLETTEPGDEAFDYKRHRSHFASCPNAAEWGTPMRR